MSRAKVASRAECTDPASKVIQAVIAAMKVVFDPASMCPPLGGGSTKVWLFAGEGAPIDEVNCDQPMLWVRISQRFRSEEFPDQAVVINPCGAPEVIVVECGVARCCITQDNATMDQYADEAAVSLDDSWRLNKVMCVVEGELRGEHNVGTEAIVPWGPEGGIIAWTVQLYVSV